MLTFGNHFGLVSVSPCPVFQCAGVDIQPGEWLPDDVFILHAETLLSVVIHVGHITLKHIADVC